MGNWLAVSRKESAALPFNLDRAMAGDVVEILHNGEWIESDLNAVDWLYVKELHQAEENNLELSKSRIIRMKYPPKITPPPKPA